MPNYDFKSLSYYDFELLVRDLLQKELNTTLESFKIGRDGGIDLRYRADSANNLIVQCKHYASSNFKDLLKNLKKRESLKVEKLKPDKYILATSIGLSPANKDKIIAVFSPFCRTSCLVFGKEDLNNLLGKFPEIEKQNFKLWLTSKSVLDQILHSSIFNQTELEIESIRKKLSYYVQNSSFFDAIRILDEMNYCIITGIPGIGKTTLAEILIIHYLDQGYQPVKITSDIEEGFKLFNKSEKQVFYYDDFLGQTSLVEKLNKNEDERILSFIRTIYNSRNSKFIFTTREYILNQAKNTYERLALSDFDINKCIVELESYTKFDRAKILFNHVYFSELPIFYKEALLVDKSYMRIVNHRNYNPRIIEWMTDDLKMIEAKPDDYVSTFLANLDDPQKLWKHAFEKQLTRAGRSLLLVLATLPDRVLVQDLEEAFKSLHYKQAKKHNFSTNSNDFKKSLETLEANFITIEKSCKDLVVRFHNPSIRDFVGRYITTNVDQVEGLIESFVNFEQCQKLWDLCSSKEELSQSSQNPLLNVSHCFLQAIKRCFESNSYQLINVHVADAIYLRRSDIIYENRVLFGYTVAKIFKSKESVNLFQHLLSRLLATYRETQVGNKEALTLFLLNTFANNDFKFIPFKSDCLNTCKSFLMKRFETIDDFDCFLAFKNTFPDIVSDSDFEEVRQQFIDFYEDEVDIYERQIDYSVAVTQFTDLLANVASVFKVDIEYELDNLMDRSAYLEELETRGSDGEPEDSYRFENKDLKQETTEEARIDSLFSVLLEDN